mgnify:CR=1 FL=1
MTHNEPIGIFDSGVGGLTVMREIMRRLPNENLIYFGDTARVPYGSKSKDTIGKYSGQIVRFLKTKNVKAIVIACNTASSLALDDLRKKSDLPIIGVVEPGAVMAAKTTQTQVVGVIGTVSTIKSQIYNRKLMAINPEITLISKACPLFCPLVEEGLLEDRVTEDIASRYLHELKEYDLDTLILGCTHYPLLRHTIARIMGESVHLINPAYETAKFLKEELEEKDLLRKGEVSLDDVRYEYYVSDGEERFVSFADSVLSCDVKEATQINIEEY